MTQFPNGANCVRKAEKIFIGDDMKTSTAKSKDSFQELLKGYLKKDLKEARGFLMRVIKGQEKDTVYDPKSGTVIEKPTAVAVRVDAVNALNKLVVARVVPEVKADQTVNMNHKTTVDDAAQTVEKRKREEKAKIEKEAREQGKLAKVAVGDSR
ncbi:MAG: hypothetical protein FD174_2592 [Geobacteraceae bacterium]|nr:MAG: hypothetical protein FD174_2592 [Geobacteraceae bacterium]